MERMSTLDAGFFFVEHANVPMHLGSLAVFEGPAPFYQELVDLYTAKLPRVPRYRQVVQTAPLRVFRPAWADDEHFEIGYHLRHAAVPQPGPARRLAVPSASSLNGPIGPHRQWVWTTASLSRVKGIRSELGGTVNDVVL